MKNQYSLITQAILRTRKACYLFFKKTKTKRNIIIFDGFDGNTFTKDLFIFLGWGGGGAPNNKKITWFAPFKATIPSFAQGTIHSLQQRTLPPACYVNFVTLGMNHAETPVGRRLSFLEGAAPRPQKPETTPHLHHNAHILGM